MSAPSVVCESADLDTFWNFSRIVFLVPVIEPVASRTTILNSSYLELKLEAYVDVPGRETRVFQLISVPVSFTVSHHLVEAVTFTAFNSYTVAVSAASAAVVPNCPRSTES